MTSENNPKSRYLLDSLALIWRVVSWILLIPVCLFILLGSEAKQAIAPKKSSGS